MTPSLSVQNIVQKRFGRGTEVTFRIPFLIDIYNAISPKHTVRNTVIEYITACAKTNKKTHWTQAIVLNSDGVMTHSLSGKLTVLKGFDKGPELTIPVQFLIDIYNAISPKHTMQNAVIEYITTCARTNKKAHWTRAIVLNSNGFMTLNESLWEFAIYRGKQETRMESAGKSFSDLYRQLDYLVSFYEHERQIVIDQDLEDANPLLPMPACSQELEYMRNHADKLAALVNQFKLGLANNIARTMLDGCQEKNQNEKTEDVNNSHAKSVGNGNS